MSVAKSDTALRWRTIGLWTLKTLLAALFVVAGGSKLIGSPAMVDAFAQIGLGQWFRYVTGALEVIGAIAILVPAVAALGGTLLAVIMIGAFLTHLLVVPGSLVPALVLFALCSLIVFAHREQIAALRAKLA